MFGKKQRIIETQKALIADLREEIEHKERIKKIQHDRIMQLQEENFILNRIVHGSGYAADIDFPNSEKGGSDHTGAVNVSDILNL